jgi:hypothetical protein
MYSIESCFGPGDGHAEPWFRFYQCERKEVSQPILDLLQATAGLTGEHLENYGWVVDTTAWAALTQYIHWCNSEGLDFAFHISQVQEDDDYYIRTISNKLKEFGA